MVKSFIRSKSDLSSIPFILREVRSLKKVEFFQHILFLSSVKTMAFEKEEVPLQATPRNESRLYTKAL